MSLKTKALAEKLAFVARAQPVTLEQGQTVGEALALMRAKRAHCVLVCRDGKLVGVFTERDYLMKAAGSAKPSDPIEAYMSRGPSTVRLEQTVGDAAELMDAKGLRNLPIVDEKGAPASLVTVGTIIQYLADHFPAAVVNRPPQPHTSAQESDGA